MDILDKIISANIFKKEIILKRNEFLKAENSIDSNIYFVKNGSLKISIINEGEEQIIRFGYDNNLIVALDSFISENKSDYVIQAIKKSTVLVAEKKNFMAFVNSSSENQNFYIRLLEDLVLQQLEREKDLLLDSPKDRFDRVLARSQQLFQLIPNKLIANYLRMSPETFSRLKKS